MVLEHIKQWPLIWKSISIHLHRIKNVGSSWSAVCCPLCVLKARREFPSEQLGSCSVARLLLLQILFISLELEIKTVFNVRFKARLGYPKYMLQRHSRDGLGLWLPGGPFGNFSLSLGYQFGCRWICLVKSGNMWKIVLKHSLCFREPVSWQVLAASLWSEVRALDLLGRALGSRPFGAAIGLLGAPAGLLEATWFTPDEY